MVAQELRSSLLLALAVEGEGLLGNTEGLKKCKHSICKVQCLKKGVRRGTCVGNLNNPNLEGSNTLLSNYENHSFVIIQIL